jgi:hypothetical protein
MLSILLYMQVSMPTSSSVLLLASSLLLAYMLANVSIVAEDPAVAVALIC